jgi:NAD(P)-dependent dehydrogenase (short-subunit alcohol dehydrogenase family)
VTDEARWAEVIASIEAKHGRLDVLVSNAGIAIMKPLIDMSLDEWRRQNAVNIDGLCKSFNSNDYKQIKTKMKSSFGAKAKAHSRSGYWNHYHLTLTEIKDKY